MGEGRQSGKGLDLNRYSLVSAVSNMLQKLKKKLGKDSTVLVLEQGMSVSTNINAPSVLSFLYAEIFTWTILQIVL